MKTYSKDLLNKIISVIKHYYPEGIDDVFNHKKKSHTTEYKRLKSKLEDIGIIRHQWSLFIKSLDKSEILYYEDPFFKYSDLKGPNFQIQISLETYIITLKISPLFPVYTYLAKKPGTLEAYRNFSSTDGDKKKLKEVIELFKVAFPDFILLPEELADIKIPNYATGPFMLGEAKISDYLFDFYPEKKEGFDNFPFVTLKQKPINIPEEELLEKLVSTIRHYYPKNLDETFDWEIMYETKEYKRLMLKLEAAAKSKANWSSFTNLLITHGYNVSDYSSLPKYNSCFHAIISSQKLTLSVCVSAIFPGYCFIIAPRDLSYTLWCKHPIELEELVVPILGFLEKAFPQYTCIPKNILELQVPNYSIEPFPIGKGKIMNYIFTYLSQFDHTLV